MATPPKIGGELENKTSTRKTESGCLSIKVSQGFEYRHR